MTVREPAHPAAADIARWRANLQGEVDGTAVYQAMAASERDTGLATVYGRLAEAVLIEVSRGARFEDRVGAELLPLDPVGGTGDAKPLAARAILTEIVHVEHAGSLNDVRVGHAAFVPTAPRARPKDRSAGFHPMPRVCGTGEPDRW